jgi:hypothetical protein
LLVSLRHKLSITSNHNAIHIAYTQFRLSRLQCIPCCARCCSCSAVPQHRPPARPL